MMTSKQKRANSKYLYCVVKLLLKNNIGNTVSLAKK